MKETKLWTWHIFAGILIFILLGIHMIVTHMDALLMIQNPFGANAIEWQNVVFRAQRFSQALFYVMLLGFALYHGLYGFRNILFELSLSETTQKVINVSFVVVGLFLFCFGSWAAVAAFAFLHQA